MPPSDILLSQLSKIVKKNITFEFSLEDIFQQLQASVSSDVIGLIDAFIILELLFPNELYHFLLNKFEFLVEHIHVLVLQHKARLLEDALNIFFDKPDARYPDFCKLFSHFFQENRQSARSWFVANKQNLLQLSEINEKLSNILTFVDTLERPITLPPILCPELDRLAKENLKESHGVICSDLYSRPQIIAIQHLQKILQEGDYQELGELLSSENFKGVIVECRSLMLICTQLANKVHSLAHVSTESPPMGVGLARWLDEASHLSQEEEEIKQRDIDIFINELILPYQAPTNDFCSTDSDPNSYLNFNEMDLYQLEDIDILVGETYLASNFQANLTNCSSANVFQDEEIIYCLVPIGEGIVIDPLDENNLNKLRFDRLTEMLRKFVADQNLQSTSPKIIFLGILNLYGNHYFNFFLTKKSTGEIHVMIIDPSARSKPNILMATEGLTSWRHTDSKMQDSDKITRAFEYIFPNCIVDHLPFNQMLFQRDCGFHALNNIESILQTAKDKNPALTINEEGLTFRLFDDLFYMNHVKFVNGKFFYPKEVVSRSVAIRRKWLEIFHKNKFCFPVKEDIYIYDLYDQSNPMIVDSFDIRVARQINPEDPHSHENRFNLIRDISNLCQTTASIDHILIVINGDDEESLHGLLNRIIDNITKFDLRMRKTYAQDLQLALQQNNFIDNFSIRAKYLLVAIFSENLSNYFHYLLESLQLSDFNDDNVRSDLFDLVLNRLDLSSIYRYLPAHVRVLWRNFLDEKLKSTCIFLLGTVGSSLQNNIFQHFNQQGFGFNRDILIDYFQQHADSEVANGVKFLLKNAKFELMDCIDSIIYEVKNEIYTCIAEAVLNENPLEETEIEVCDEYFIGKLNQLGSDPGFFYQSFVNLSMSTENFIHDIKYFFDNFVLLRTYEKSKNELFKSFENYLLCNRILILRKEDEVNRRSFVQIYPLTHIIEMSSLSENEKSKWKGFLEKKEIKVKLETDFNQEMLVKFEGIKKFSFFVENLCFIIDRLNEFSEALQELSAKLAECHLLELNNITMNITKFHDTLVRDFSIHEDRLIESGRRITKDLQRVLLLFVDNYFRVGEMSSLEITYYLRHLFTAIFAGPELKKEYDRFINYASVLCFDNRLLLLLRENINLLLTEKMLKKINPIIFPQQVKNFLAISDRNVSKEVLAEAMQYWYTYTTRSFLSKCEPRGIFSLNNIVNLINGNFISSVMELIVRSYQEVDSDIIWNRLILHIAKLNDFHFPSDLQLSEIEMVLNCYSERDIRYLESDLSLLQKKYCSYVCQRQPISMMRLFSSAPIGIQALIEWCQKIRTFHESSNDKIYLNIFEINELLQMVTGFSYKNLDSPDAVESVYLVIAHSLVRIMSDKAHSLFKKPFLERLQQITTSEQKNLKMQDTTVSLIA